MSEWSEWRPFPDPAAGGYLVAPIGAGVYQLRVRGTKKLLLVGHGKCCAYRMTSLLPAPLGQGTRNNEGKRQAVLQSLAEVEYRTRAFPTKAAAVAFERELLTCGGLEFPT